MIFYELYGRMKEAVGGNGGMGNDVSGKEHDGMVRQVTSST